MAFDNKQEIFTKVLVSTTFTVTEEYGLTAVAIKLVSGSGTFKGNKRIANDTSDAIPLVVNEPVTVTSEQTKYIDSLIIDCSGGGQIQIIGR